MLTGLVAAGCHAVVVFTDRPFFPSHPFAPVAVVSLEEKKAGSLTTTNNNHSSVGEGGKGAVRQTLALAIESHLNGEALGTAFQIPRGITSISV